MVGVSSRNAGTERKISRQSSPRKSVNPLRGLGFTGSSVIQLIASWAERWTSQPDNESEMQLRNNEPHPQGDLRKQSVEKDEQVDGRSFNVVMLHGAAAGIRVASF